MEAHDSIASYKITKENHSKFKALADAARARNRKIRQQALETAQAILKQDHSAVAKASIAVQINLLHQLIVSQIVKMQSGLGTGSGQGCTQVQRLREMVLCEREMLELHGMLQCDGVVNERVRMDAEKLMREDPEVVLEAVREGVKGEIEAMLEVPVVGGDSVE